MRPVGPPLLALVLALAIPATAIAQEPAELPPIEQPAAAGTPLETYLAALAERRLIAAETGSVERLRELVREGEQLFLQERYDQAALLLFEVAESPRFADFVDLDEFRGAEFMLARALEKLGALRTASRYLERILGRGMEDVYFGPAFRKYVDVALASGDPAGFIAGLEGVVDTDDLSEDSQNELRYLRGRERYDARAWEEAEAHFSEITRRSRFFAGGQYLRGVIAARGGDLPAAEEHFCTIASTGDSDRFTFFVDDRYFEVKDLARIALGRVAHEGQRADDAFYYYFQVPQDSPRVAEALFEASYSMYEGGDYETAVDLLDQLQTRFPESAFADEAALLRGYVHLGRCEFEEANRLFVRFAEIFGPVRNEVTRIVQNPARQQRLYEELLSSDRRDRERARLGEDAEDEETGDASATRRLLMAMLQVDPTFYRLHADVRTLDAESGRAGRLTTDIAELRGRIDGRDRPVAAAELDEGWDEGSEMRQDIEGARAVLTGLTEQLDAMRRAGAPRAQLRPLETEIRGLSQRLAALEQQLEQANAEVASGTSATEAGDDLGRLLQRDLAAARRLPARIAAMRARMVEAGNAAALSAVQVLDRRLGSGLRRARIGRIDAVMGSKRRIEIQIESLAAGRFPPELQDPLRVQGLLRDDEEYWPFEGELWEDEFDEADPVEDVLEEEAE